jgi:hypothetical protein
MQRLQDQQNINQSIKVLLSQVQDFMHTFIGRDNANLLLNLDMRETIENLFRYTLDVIAFIRKYTKSGHIGQSQCHDHNLAMNCSLMHSCSS